MRTVIARLAVAAALLALAVALPYERRALIRAWTTYDAAPGDPPALPRGDGPGLAPAARVRVVLVDGLAADVARTLPTWSATCARGTALGVDVGFPTISLPVEVALWTGLVQQQTGVVFRSDRPLVPPLAAPAIPPQVPGAIAIAESHGYIVRSLGFATVEPAADPADPARDAELPKQGPAWTDLWQLHARDAVASASRLVFVHVLRVDVAGHKHGRDSDAYRAIARDADAIVGSLVAAAPDARWFLLSDHGHLARGGPGGEEREVRHVEACIAGPGVAVQRGTLVHVVDVARAIADSVGATLDPASRARPLSVAIASPLPDDLAVPALPFGRELLAIVLVVVAAAATAWAVGRRVWLLPWWFAVACALFVTIRGTPTMSTAMIYPRLGVDMFVTWLAALPLAVAATWFGVERTALARVVVAQLALPLAATAAALTACGAWPAMVGADDAPVAPTFTAWTSPLLLMAAQGVAAVALAVLGTLARRAFGRRSRAAARRTASAGG
jgi:hypothetical protein